MNLLRLLQRDVQPEVDLRRTYDAIVIGSGAAGGMAAHVLTSQGMKVLMLEAGKKLDIDKELKSMEWPYEHPRRGEMPPGHHALSLNEYTIRQPPYAADSKFPKVHSYVQGWSGSDYSKNVVVDEKEHPYTGTNYAWVRARCLGGKTNIWGRLALRLSDYDFKAKTHDGYGEDWPISYKDIEPYYDRVDRYLGISGVKENLPYLPDSLFQRPTRLASAEVTLRTSLQKMNRVLTPYRAGVTTDGLKHNKYRSRCFGRGACNRRVGGCDIHAAFDSPTGLIYPAMDTGNLVLRTNSIAREILVDKGTGKASGVSFIDSETGRTYEVFAKVVVLAASTLESARLLLLSKSGAHPNGIGNSSGHVGHNFCEHVMGPGVTGLVKDRVGKS
jgi:glucoside 3-dehydrogenase (cytochrome c) catalytic subunit